MKTSSPNNLSSIFEIGKARGQVRSIKNFVSQIVWAPTASPCLELRIHERSGYNLIKQAFRHLLRSLTNYLT